MNPQIEFKHVLGELSVNRNDPCEVVRELISNSYDAKAKSIIYAPLKEESGFLFFDDGTGLSTKELTNGITPYEAFFSIGKSTKKKGESIGYKCQGSKLCFACNRILVITRSECDSQWLFKVVENPRQNLSINYDISPENTDSPWVELASFLSTLSAKTQNTLDFFDESFFQSRFQSGTLIVIQELDTENFEKHFLFEDDFISSYLSNYVRFYTRHGDVRVITKEQGFSPNHVLQVAKPIETAELAFIVNGQEMRIQGGFPYLAASSSDTEVKSPSQISRLRDGRFMARSAKTFNVSGSKFSIVATVDGNRRAHEEYTTLDRKGTARSGVRLVDQRGFFVAVNGIKICRFMDIFYNTELSDYSVLADGESPGHFSIIVNGDFDLVTNRNSLSRKAFDILSSPAFLSEIRKFFDDFKRNSAVFSELISRLKKESTENKLNEQISILDASKKAIKLRERFRISSSESNELYLSPQPGEEYLVGVLYAKLATIVPSGSPFSEFWKKVLTFSTQGIDSVGMRDKSSTSPLVESNLISIEYKYNFTDSGPFNHALAIVDYIVAWTVNLPDSCKIKDEYTCFGEVNKISEGVWNISNIENEGGGCYDDRLVVVISLKQLIESTFNARFSTP
ncbi:ATP-binding protein [Deefgea rivuli]|uniref:ATP-binding protein n=1 Tax=Deefgea rivuli TaxID=400948 RepID=UPI0006840E41|nr:ATP-binding protein [Deefgea rivuli]